MVNLNMRYSLYVNDLMCISITDEASHLLDVNLSYSSTVDSEVGLNFIALNFIDTLTSSASTVEYKPGHGQNCLYCRGLARETYPHHSQ